MDMNLQSGDKAPPFELNNANSKVGEAIMTTADVAGVNGTVIVFECNHCPYVIASSKHCEWECEKSIRQANKDPKQHVDKFQLR